MNRRKIIKMAALATGVAVSAPLLSTLLSGCQTPAVDNDADYELTFFSKKEFQFLRDVVDTILPKTDSPAATEVGVHRMIDSMVGKVYAADDKATYQKNFADFFKHLHGEGDKNNFAALSATDRLKKLQALASNNEDAMKSATKAFQDLKQQTVAYYLSTEEVATKFLNYLPVPGEYQPCITVAEAGGKAWAL